MAKYDLKIRARTMRCQGESIIVIARKLGVSKGTVSGWCKDIELTEQQFENLRKNKGVSFLTGQRMGAEANKKKKLNVIKQLDKWSKHIVKKVSKRELLLIATALYWSEGSKSDSTSSFVFVNSDPEMILLMKLFLVQILEVKKEDIVCSIQINRIHEPRISVVLSFWQKLLELPKNQLRKPYYIDTKISKIYENYDVYYGTCRLIVIRGKHVKYKMLSLIKAVIDDICRHSSGS